MPDDMIRRHGPATARHPLMLDSPHSGRFCPADFDAAVDQAALRDGEDCFIDALWLPATERGVPLLAAQFSRTYIDPNRHAGDIDLDLVDGGAWPVQGAGAWQPSGKAGIGKALVWRLLDDGRPIYDRRLSVAELQNRIAVHHRPYHAALRALLDAAHAQFGVAYHLNGHSMNPVSGLLGNADGSGAGRPRADMVLGDRDGTTCAPSFTTFVREALPGMGYRVAVNHLFKGVELVRAFAEPAGDRHSLQFEVNKLLSMDLATRQPHAGFARLQADLMRLVDGVCGRFAPGQQAAGPPRVTAPPSRPSTSAA